MAKTKYEELLKKRELIDKELKPLTAYLEAVGGLEVKKRAGRKKKEA